MSDDLTIKIVVDDSDAKATIKADDAALSSLGQTAQKTGGFISDYEKQVRATVSAHQASTTASDQFKTSTSNLASQLAAAQQNVKDITAAIQTYNLAAGSTASNQMAQQLASATAEVNRLSAALGDVKPKLDAVAAGMTQAGKTSADSIKLIAGMSQAGRDAATGFQVATDAGSSFGSMLTTITERLLIYASVRGIINAISSTVQFGLELERLSAQTGMGVQAIQQLNYESAATGVPLTSLTNAVSQLQRKLAEEDGGAVKAVQQLGLNFNQIRAMQPEQQFDVIATALSKVKDQSQYAALSAELFSARSGSAIAAVIKNYEDLKTEAENSNAVLTDQQVAGIAEVGKAWDTAWLKAKAYFAQVLLLGPQLPYIPAFNNSGNLAGPTDSQTVAAQLSFFATQPQQPKQDTGALQTQAFVNQMNSQFVAGQPGQAAAFRPVSVPDLSGTSKQSTADIFSANQAGKDLDKSTEDQIAATKRAQTATEESVKATTQLWDDYAKAVATVSGDTLDAQLADVNKWYDAQYAALTKSTANEQQKADRSTALNSAYYEKLEAVRTTDANKQQTENEALAAKTQEMWDDYYKNIATEDGQKVDAQIAGAAKWYDTQYALIEKSKADEAKKNDALITLNTDYSSKLDAIHAKDDAATQKRADAYTKTWQKAADDTNKLWDEAAAIENAAGLKGLALQEANIDKEAQQKKDAFQKEIDAGKAFEDQRWAQDAAIDAVALAKKAQDEAAAATKRNELLLNLDVQDQQARQQLNGKTLASALAVNQQELVAYEAKLQAEGMLDQTATLAAEKLYADRAAVIKQTFQQATIDAAASVATSLVNLVPANSAFKQTATDLAGIATAAASATKAVQQFGANSAQAGASVVGLAVTWYNFWLNLANSMNAAETAALNLQQSQLLAAQFHTTSLFSDELSRSISTLSVSLDGITGTASAAGMHINDIVKELGGWASLTTDQLKAVENAIDSVSQRTVLPGGNTVLQGGIEQGLLAIIEKNPGSTGAAQATQQLDQALHDMGQAAIDAGKPVDQFFLDIVTKAQQAGIALTQTTALIQGQATAFATGLNDLLTQPMIVDAAAIGKTVSDAQDAVKTATTAQQDVITKMMAGAPTTLALAAAQKAADNIAAPTAANVQAAQDAVLKAFQAQQDAIAKAGKSSSDYKTTTDALTTAQATLTDALASQKVAADRNKDALANLGQEAVIAFNAGIASGQSFVASLNAIAPSLTTIQKAYKDLGLTIDDAATKGLVLENTILNGTADAPNSLGKAIAGLGALFQAALNIPGLENKDAFQTQQGSLASLYTQTQAASANAGVTGDAGTIAALQPFQQTLHAMQDWAAQNKLALDPLTQQMIDQSKALGVWQDEQQTDGDKTRQSIADLITSNDTLVKAMGGLASALGSPTASGSQTPGRLTAHRTAAPTTGDLAPLAPGTLTPAAPGPYDPSAPVFGSEAYVRSPTLATVGDSLGGEFVLKPSTVNSWLGTALTMGGTISTAKPTTTAAAVPLTATTTSTFDLTSATVALSNASITLQNAAVTLLDAAHTLTSMTWPTAAPAGPTAPGGAGPWIGAGPPTAPTIWTDKAAKVPAFATEAFVRSPTLAMVGDVAGGEFVIKPSTLASWVNAGYSYGHDAPGAFPSTAAVGSLNAARPTSTAPPTPAAPQQNISKSYSVSVTAKDPQLEEQWLRDWMRRDGVEINVEEIEDGRNVSRINRALARSAGQSS